MQVIAYNFTFLLGHELKQLFQLENRTFFLLLRVIMDKCLLSPFLCHNSEKIQFKLAV